MSLPSPSSYAWIDDSMWEVAACITVAVGAQVSEVARAFGADLSAPAAVHPDSDFWWAEQPGVAFVEAQGAVIAVEVNGFEGSRTEVLASASGRGKAASAYWNVDAMTYFGCARGGQAICSSEFMAEGERDALPAEVRPLAELADGDDDSWAAIALAMVEAFTGVAVTEELLSAAKVGYPLRRQ
jgi:hypothetical protein